MSLGNNGYQSEKRGSYFQGVVIMLFLMVMAMLGLTLLVSALLSGCESGGDTGNAPVYNQNGVCVQNCGTASDGSVYPPGDTCDHDGCGFQPQKDYVAPPCHVPTDPKIKKWCMPQAYKDASCYKFDGACEDGGIPCFETDGWTPLHCVSDKANCTNGLTSMCSPYPINKECASDKDCSVPCEEWPPEVCQGLPCLLVGKWNCIFGIYSSGQVSSATYDYTDLEFYDNGDKYCRFDDFNYKPGDSVIRSNDGEVIKLTKFCNSPGANELLYLEDLKACESDEDCTDFPSGPCKGIDAWGDDGLCAGDSYLRYQCQSSDNCNYVPDNNFCNGEFCQHGSFPCTSDEDCQEASALYRTCFGACAKTGETCEYIHGSDTCPLNIKSTCNLKLEGLQKIDAEGNVTAQCFKIEE